MIPIRMKHHLFSDTSTGLNVVAIGGGNGLSTLLSGLKRYVHAEEAEPVVEAAAAAPAADAKAAPAADGKAAPAADAKKDGGKKEGGKK